MGPEGGIHSVSRKSTGHSLFVPRSITGTAVTQGCSHSDKYGGMSRFEGRRLPAFGTSWMGFERIDCRVPNGLWLLSGREC